jgi:hypothetical protein
VAEAGILGRRERLEHAPLVEHLLLHLLDPRQHLETGLELLARIDAIAASSSWMMSFIHSSVTWCCTMNSISSWCGGSDSGCCADRTWSSRR